MDFWLRSKNWLNELFSTSWDDVKQEFNPTTVAQGVATGLILTAVLAPFVPALGAAAAAGGVVKLIADLGANLAAGKAGEVLTDQQPANIQLSSEQLLAIAPLVQAEIMKDEQLARFADLIVQKLNLSEGLQSSRLSEDDIQRIVAAVGREKQQIINKAGRDIYQQVGDHNTQNIYNYAPPTAPALDRSFTYGLPPLPQPFQPRDELMTALKEKLAQGNTALSAEGMFGVGKTTIAAALAHEQYASGWDILWAAVTKTPNVEAVLGSWMAAVGLDTRSHPDSQAYPALIQRELSSRDRPVLVVLDDVWPNSPTFQFKKVLPPKGVCLITTRDDKVAGNDSIVLVGDLTKTQAAGLLDKLCPDAMELDRAAVLAVAESVGRLALLLVLIGGYLNERRKRPLQQAIADLTARRDVWLARTSNHRKQQGVSDQEQETVAEIVALSLDDLDQQAQATFTALAAFAPKPADFSYAALQAVSGVDGETATDTLLNCHLLEVAENDRLQVHQAVALVAAQRTGAEQTARSLASFARYYDDFMEGNRHQPPLIQSEFAQLERAVATYRAVNKREAARLLNNIGGVYNALGQKQVALQYYSDALPIFREVGDRAGEATTLNNIGGVYDALGQKQVALQYYSDALPISHEVGDQFGVGVTLHNIGTIYFEAGDLQQAQTHFEQAIKLAHDVQHPELMQASEGYLNETRRRLAS